jgi:DNA-binding Xre family transcriptional regulator
MKIKVSIRETAEKRGIKNPYQLQKKAGLAPSNAVKLYNNNIVQISMKTLAKLCEALKCKPNDLLILKRSE